MARTRKNWKPAEDAYIHAHYLKDQTVAQVAAHLGRTPSSVFARTKRLGLSGESNWTPEEDAYLRSANATATLKDMCGHLGRTRLSVRHRMRRLGVKRGPTPRPWTAAETAHLVFKCEKFGLLQLAKQLNRSEALVHKKMKDLGLKGYCAMYTLTQCEELSGYNDVQLKRARDALGQVWRKRNGSKARAVAYVITPKQYLLCLEWLKQDGRTLPPSESLGGNGPAIDVNPGAARSCESDSGRCAA